MNPKVTVIVLNWNGVVDTLDCLRSLMQVTYPNKEIVVVDNASTDSSVEAIRAAHPGLTLIVNDQNMGYADGNNVGTQYALDTGADYVLLLNNDTVVDPEFLTELVKAAEDHPEAGAFGSKIYFLDEPKMLWFAGSRWLPSEARFTHEGFQEIDDQNRYESLIPSDYITGCVLMAPARVLREIGLLDSRYFLTFEDTDWCCRVRRAGYRCLVVPRSKVWHKVSRSFGGEKSPLRNYFMIRNWMLCLESNFTLSERFAILPAFLRQLAWEFLSARSASFSGRMYQRKVMAIALLDYARRRFGDCPQWLRTEPPARRMSKMAVH